MRTIYGDDGGDGKVDGSGIKVDDDDEDEDGSGGKSTTGLGRRSDDGLVEDWPLGVALPVLFWLP